jgi:hypothetical protein
MSLIEKLSEHFTCYWGGVRATRSSFHQRDYRDRRIPARRETSEPRPWKCAARFAADAHILDLRALGRSEIHCALQSFDDRRKAWALEPAGPGGNTPIATLAP